MSYLYRLGFRGLSGIGRYWLEACSKQASRYGAAVPATFRWLTELYSRRTSSLRRSKEQNPVPIGQAFNRLAIGVAALITLAACAEQTAAPSPTAAPTLVASLTATTAATSAAIGETPTAADVTPGVATETPVVITVEPLLGQAIAPPLDITLPEGWTEQMNDTLLLTDVDAMRPIPFVVWSGPVTGGRGRIVLLWGFPSVTNGNPFETPLETPAPDPWADGLRLLRLAVVDQGCNIGTDLRRDYRVGLLPAQGTQFSAVDCPESPDTRGWFAGLNEAGVNFVFFLFTDPIDAMTLADDEMQAILDTILFRPIE